MKYPVIEIDKTWPERDLPRNFCAAGFFNLQKNRRGIYMAVYVMTAVLIQFYELDLPSGIKH